MKNNGKENLWLNLNGIIKNVCCKTKSDVDAEANNNNEKNYD